jgi:hypothetical protein
MVVFVAKHDVIPEFKKRNVVLFDRTVTICLKKESALYWASGGYNCGQVFSY